MSQLPPLREDDSTPPVKRRRGRQPRPSLLSSRIKNAVANFANQVGQPRVIEPAGFRDFRGWLAFIAGPAAAPAWGPLVHAVIQDTDSTARTINAIKPDLVREIVKAVVIPRDDESSKLVSTNCGRQCARPTNGVTLMIILDKVFENPRQWKDSIPSVTVVQPPQIRPNPLTYQHRPSTSPSSHISQPLTSSIGQPQNSSSLPSLYRLCNPSVSTHPMHIARSENLQHVSQTIPLHSQPLHISNKSESPAPLPSFRELEDSLQSPAYLGKRPRR